MNIFKFFRRNTEAAAVATQPVAAAIAGVERGSGARKTVIPNASRNAPAAAPVVTPIPVAAAAPPPTPSMAVAPAAVPARTVSFASTATRPRDIPPAVALALEARVDRVISLEIGDIIAQLPADMLKPTAGKDMSRRILLKAADVERGMASGRPVSSLGTIAQQASDFFACTISPNDSTPVSLPFSKVLDQFTRLQVRADQVRDESVPQVETPFLKLTVEDGARFGTSTPLEAPQAADLPPVRMEPATAKSIAAAEPEPAVAEKNQAPFPIRLPVVPPPRSHANGHGNGATAATAPTAAAGPTRIPFKLSVNGTGAPAESVPAPSRPPFPTPASPAAPVRIPFKLAVPAEPAPKLHALPPARPTGPQTISLLLKPILQGLPDFQLSGDPDEVPDDVRIELPFAVIAPQLALGRVSITPQIFEDALPDEYLRLFDANEANTPVALPLQEVLKNLPASSLEMRDDQEEQETGADFETPFSVKAREDAQRFPVAAPAAPAPVEPAAPLAVLPALDEISANLARSPLQQALDTDDEVDAKSAMALASELPGIRACALLFADGLSLAGDLPDDVQAEGLCAMAPSLLKRVGEHLLETRLGELNAITLHCANTPITFFMHGNVCLAALHYGGDISTEIRERLARIVQEMARMYSKTS